MEKVELLAPAGSPEGFYGALHAGADAVYLGGERFGARAYADNFTEEELLTCIRYAHIFGKRVYLTVNTLVKETEFQDLRPWLEPFYRAGLDGVIVQDIGVFTYIKRYFPGLALHVSTQMNLTGEYGAAYLKKLGAVRIVPARELSLAEVKEIKRETGLELECFIHGAMCYCYSGQCLFSSILGGRSGNRGRCAQPCRLPYKVELPGNVTKECYPLSLKDMCTIEHLPELLEAGIDSFKIEGRMKKPEYAAGVTAIYRKYIDRYYAGEDCQVSEADLRTLSKLYLRSERQDGYYYRHNGRDMVTLQNPSYQGADEELSSRVRTAYIETKPKLPLEMGLQLTVGMPARLACSAQGAGTVVEGDIVAPAQKQPITEENIRKQMGKLGDTIFYLQNLEIQLQDNCFYPLKALNELRRQAVASLEDCLIEQNGLVYSGRTNADRTNADRKDTLYRNYQNGDVSQKVYGNKCSQAGTFHVLVHTMEQLGAVVEMCSTTNRNGQNSSEAWTCISRIYLEADLALQLNNDKGKAEQLKAVQQKAGQVSGGQLCDKSPIEFMIALPQILRKRDEAYLERVWEAFQSADLYSGFLVRSMDGMGFLDAHMGQRDFEIYTDANFYRWNLESLRAIPTDGFCLPYELKAADQRKLAAYGSMTEVKGDRGGVPAVEKIVYGYIPLMHTANCVFNTMAGCGQNKKGKSENAGTGSKLCYLTDRYRKHFPVYRNCQHCVNVIYNCVPLALHKEMAKWRENVAFRLDFTMESRAEALAVLGYFLDGGKGEPPFQEYTTGHEKRGAE